MREAEERRKKELAWGKASLRHSVPLSVSLFVSVSLYIRVKLSSVSSPLCCVSRRGDQRGEMRKKV